jgi:hypothetical protein
MKTVCAICGQTGKPEFTIRASWTQAGGWGAIPPAARVHVPCDAKEQALLKSGRLRLEQLWQGVREETGP